MNHFDFSSSNFWEQLHRYCYDESGSGATQESVSRILKDVKERGEAAAIEWTAKIDGAEFTSSELKIDPEVLNQSAKILSKEQRRAILKAIDCVESFHKAALPKSWKGKNPHGALVGEQFYPLSRVGIWVPGGHTPLVSTVVMSTVLANVAKVPEVAVFTPPRPNGEIDPHLLATLHLCKVKEVYRMGGVAAIGCMAYGTKNIKPVVKIFGPGNAYIIEAKRQVFGTVGIDLLPGPSEVMVLSDGSTPPEYAAADLLAQAEHGSGKERIYLVAINQEWIKAVEQSLVEQVERLPHKEKIKEILEKRCLIVKTQNLNQASEVANFIAPEHLELHVAKDEKRHLMKQITTAGALLSNEQTPAVLGDYTAGPSHTLPTGLAGRFSSGLQVSDFFRRTSIVEYGAHSLLEAQPIVDCLSEIENLIAHKESFHIRLRPKSPDVKI